ncbi:MAG: hypothetical protein V1810_02745 [Candidatus Beckwithbacteria bacterium]
MTKAQIKQVNVTISRKCRLCLVGSISLVLILTLIKIVAANQTATLGQNLEAIKQQTNLIRQQNLQLKSQLAIKTGGLHELQDQALNQGFTDKPQIKYITQPQTVAQSRP